MINLFNKLIARFGFQLVSTKPDTSLVEATVKFMKEYPDFISGPVGKPYNFYMGDINFVQQEVNGEFRPVSGGTYSKTYFLRLSSSEAKGGYYFNIEGDGFFQEELEEKLKNDC
jgi:hypothetical protein